MTLAFVCLGAWFAISSLPNPLGILFGLLVASPAVLTAPRLGKLDKDDVTVDRDEAPTLWQLCDEVAAALGVRPVDVIVVDDAYNASWAILGWRRRRVLTLGLPFLTALEPGERVALVAHELAHAKNGDSSRGVFVGGAVGALVEIHGIVRPARNPDGIELILNVFFALLAKPVWWLLHLEFHLLRRDSQRAEYLADALAVTVAGSAAVISLHEKSLLSSTFWSVVQHGARRREEDLFAELTRALRAVSQRERERRRRVARLEESRLSDSHPPIARRIELVERRAAAEPRVALSPADSDAVDVELAPHRPRAQEALIDLYRASVHYR